MTNATAETQATTESSEVDPKSLPDRDRIALDMGWPVKSVYARLSALGLLVPCTRCHGTGTYSRCQTWGTTCFKCGGRPHVPGSGKQMPKYTKKLVKKIREAVDAGGLVEYLEKVARIQEAKKATPELLNAAHKAYSRTADVYEAAYKVSDKARYAGESNPIPEPLHAAQRQANRLYWGHDGYRPIGPVMMSVKDVERAVLHGEIDAQQAVEILKLRIESLNEIAW